MTGGTPRRRATHATHEVFFRDELVQKHVFDQDQITIGRFDLHYICLTGPTMAERRDAAHSGVG